MALNRRWIKLGRLFMVAWLAFFIYPLSAFLTDRFSTETRTGGLLLLLALALIWAWFWTRIIAGPDRRYMVPAIVAATLILTVFTLRTPPRYGSLYLYPVIMAGAAFPWRRGVAAVVVLSVLAAPQRFARRLRSRGRLFAGRSEPAAEPGTRTDRPVGGRGGASAVCPRPS
jgi:hypothetical protein